MSRSSVSRAARAPAAAFSCSSRFALVSEAVAVRSALDKSTHSWHSQLELSAPLALCTQTQRRLLHTVPYSSFKHSTEARGRAVANAALFGRAPERLEFTSTELLDARGDRVMMSNSASWGPLFLDGLPYRQIVDWARAVPSGLQGDCKVLTLAGPVKAGKTAVLKRVLPGILQEQYATGGYRGRQPVVFKFDFSLYYSPSEAANHLASAAWSEAYRLGFEISVARETGDKALAEVVRVIRELATGIAAAGGELVLLLDEAHGPLLTTTSPEEAAAYAAMIQGVCESCLSNNARVAITGSRMMTLLDALRKGPSGSAEGDYVLWNNMTLVQLGATPPPATAAAMAQVMISLDSLRWPREKKLSTHITPAYVLERLASVSCRNASSDGWPPSPLPLLAPRAAVIKWFGYSVHMKSLEEDTREGIAQRALGMVMGQVLEEGWIDLPRALGRMTRLERQHIYRLATGKITRSELRRASKELSGDNSFYQVLETFCEPVPTESDHDAMQLMPPYSALLGCILSPQGNVLLELKPGDSYWAFEATMRDRFRFFGRHATHEVLSGCGSAVSSAVLASLASAGVGVKTGNPAQPFRPPTTLQELVQPPVIRAVLERVATWPASVKRDWWLHGSDRVLADSLAAFHALCDAEATGARTAEVQALAATMGLHVLVWFSNIGPSLFVPTGEMARAGLRAFVVSDAVEAAVKAWESAGNAVVDGVPKLPVAAYRYAGE